VRGMWLVRIVIRGQADRRHCGICRWGFPPYKIVLGSLCELLLGSISKVRVCGMVSGSILGRRIASWRDGTGCTVVVGGLDWSKGEDSPGEREFKSTSLI
jgi:hypothetical protein